MCKNTYIQIPIFLYNIKPCFNDQYNLNSYNNSASSTFAHTHLGLISSESALISINSMSTIKMHIQSQTISKMPNLLTFDWPLIYMSHDSDSGQ